MNKKNRLEERSKGKPTIPEGKATIYVRVAPKLKNDFAEMTKSGSEYSQGEIIEKLLEYFLEQPADVRKAILEGNHDPIKQFSELIEIQSWGDRAFAAQKWVWALQEYRSLEKRAEAAEGLKRYSWYKQAFCLNEIAISLRREAFMEDANEESTIWEKHFYLAQQALATSIEYLKKMIASLEQEADKSQKNSQHPIALFNWACCSSHQAQYLIEESLGPKNELIKPLRGLFSKEKIEPDAFKKIWQEIGAKWRTLLSSHREFKKISDSVSQYGQEAINNLRKVGVDVGSSQGHTEWIIETAQKDDDLIFMRTDDKWQSLFNAWLAGFGKMCLADAFESLHPQIIPKSKERNPK